PPSLYSGAISPSTNSQSILPASCTSSCLILMIWSSRARNRSADPVVSCFFGRIALSNAATESCFSIRGNRENEIASFQGLRHGNLAISSQQSRQKKTLAQWVRNSSRATKHSQDNIDDQCVFEILCDPWRCRFWQVIDEVKSECSENGERNVHGRSSRSYPDHVASWVVECSEIHRHRLGITENKWRVQQQ